MRCELQREIWTCPAQLLLYGSRACRTARFLCIAQHESAYLFSLDHARQQDLVRLQGGAALAELLLSVCSSAPSWVVFVLPQSRDLLCISTAPPKADRLIKVEVGAQQRGAPLLYLGERIRWLPLTTFRTHGVTGSSLASEASPELFMPLKVELCRAASGTLVAAAAGSRLLQAHSVPTSDKAGWLHCCLGAALQSLAPPLQARARPRSSMQAPMPGLQGGQ